MSSGSVAVKRTTLSSVLMEFWFAMGSGWEAGSPSGKTGGQLPRTSSDAGLGIELRRGSRNGSVFRSQFRGDEPGTHMGAHLVRSFLGPENDRTFGARFSRS